MVQNNTHSKLKTGLLCHLRIMQLVSLFNTLIVGEVSKLPLHRIYKIVIISIIYIYIYHNYISGV